MKLSNQIEEAFEYLQKVIPKPCPKIGVVLGSGLGSFVDILEERTFVESSKIPHWPVPKVKGHHGRVVFGKVGKVPVIVLQGRVHLYEGYSIQEVTFPVRVLGKMRVKSLVLTNAVGGINPNFVPGDFMLISDHINFMFTNPLVGSHDPSLGERFPDMSRPYDPEYIALAEEVGENLEIPLRKGVLIAFTGPSYETAAEVRMMQSLGGDAICMSIVPEVIVGVQMGLRILGISCITNMGTGLAQRKLTHDEVEKTARRISEKFVVLVKEIILGISKIRNKVCQ